VVIKGKDEVALERFIFSIQTMIAIESFNKDTRSTSAACPYPMLLLKMADRAASKVPWPRRRWVNTSAPSW
jgi:hypothetical protein